MSFLRVLWLSVLLACMPAAAEYPERSIRIVVPTTTGGGADTLARTIGGKLATKLGQPVVIENKPGANGLIGMDTVAKAEPNGYTLALTFTDHFVNPSLYKSQPYDLNRDFAPVAYLGALPFVVAVTPSLEATDTKSLIELAKRKKGEIRYASAGTGGSLHMAGALFGTMTGAEMEHVPYKGTSAALPDLISGRVQVIFTSAISAKPHADAGRLRLLATTGQARAPDLPNLPTVAEAGVAGYTAGIWYGILAPARTPPAVIALLNKEVNEILSSADFQAEMRKQGVVLATPGTPESFSRFYRAEIDKWAGVVKQAKVNPLD